VSFQTESRISRTVASTGTSTSRTRYTTSRTTTVLVVGGIKWSRRVRAAVAAAWRWLTDTVSAAGWLLIAASVLGLTLGLVFGWIELVAAGAIALTLLVLSVPFLFGARAYDVDLSLGHDRVVAGTDLSGALAVRNVGRGIALPGTVDVPIGEGIVEINVPLLRPQGRFDEEVVVPAHRRGIITIGPARTVRGDPLGILRRENTWEDVHTLYVHPVTTAIPSTSTGFIRDLEGNPSTLIVDADISFHALREYVPGDSQRQIHWKSTAKTGTLMVRQYEESRRSRMLIALATGDGEFADDDEFELAVSAAGSLGVRGIRDGRDVNVVVGGEIPEFARRVTRSIRELATVTTRTLLDDLSGVDRAAAVNPLLDVASLAVEAHRDVSVGFLVCGSPTTARDIQAAALAFPADVGVAAIVCNPNAEPGFRRLGQVSVITIGLLDDLRQVLARGSAS
jgi:uncharacterized protein (DUF58 family)